MPAPALNLPTPFHLPIRVGHGYDLHALQPTGDLLLGGVQVATQLSPIAHSDGDVLIHALVDALLGALAWGDIGELFPNTDPRWKNAPSHLFLTTVYTQVRQAHYRLLNADLTVLAEKPKLNPFKQAIRQNLANLLDCDMAQISLKAGTNEGMDSIGKGESLAAHATVLLVPDTPPTTR